MKQLYINNTNTVSLIGLRSAVDDAFINTGAAVLAKVTTNGTTVTGSTITLIYVTSTDGEYMANLPATLALIEDQFYTIEINVIVGSIVNNWNIPVIAKYRGEV
jgi:hypothetical protein